MDSVLQPKVEVSISSHTEGVCSVCFSPDQTKLCSAGGDTKVIFTNLQNYKTQKVFTGHGECIHGSDFSSNGIFLVTGSLDYTVRIWHVESENGNSIKLEGHSHYVYCVQYFHKDPNKVISGSFDRTIKIWDIERKKEILTLKGCEASVNSVDILPDNQTIVSGDCWDAGWGGDVRLWDFRSGKCVKILDHHEDVVSSVQFHPNTFSIASGSWDKTIKTFDFRTLQLLQNCQEHEHYVNSICFHPSGKFLLSGSRDKTIKIFDLSQKKVLSTLKDHSNQTISSVQFSPDGKFFASGSKWDNSVFLWNFPLGRMMIFREEKDTDEEERVKYLVQQDLLHIVVEDDERNVLKIRIIDDFCNIYCYKFFLVK